MLARHGVALRRPRDRHDARQLPARRDAVEPSARGSGARARRLQGADARKTSAARGAKAVSLRAICRSRRRSTTPASAPTWRCSSRRPLRDAAARRSSSSAVYRDARAAADSGAGRRRARRHPHRRPGARGAVAARRAGAGDAQRADLRAGRRGVQHQLAEAAVARSSSTSCSCRRSSATARRRRASTAVEVLEELALAHDLPRLILEWRALQKLKGTYIDALPQLVNPETGRVHTCFNQAVAATGRLSSSDPNLQNIPIRTELGREIRGAFVAEPGHVLISADYSQIELRVLAHLSGDEALIDAFTQRRRHPRSHGARRSSAPTAASASTSCAGARRSSTTRCSTGRRRSRWRRTSASRSRRRRSSSTPTSPASRGPRVHRRHARRRARETGVVKTMFGRRRLVPELTSRNGQIRAARRARTRSTCRSRARPPTSSSAR